MSNERMTLDEIAKVCGISRDEAAGRLAESERRVADAQARGLLSPPRPDMAEVFSVAEIDLLAGVVADYGKLAIWDTRPDAE